MVCVLSNFCFYSCQLLLAHRRMAPLQCVFWGHPVSQGLPSIDYFVSSDLFEDDTWAGLDGDYRAVDPSDPGQRSGPDSGPSGSSGHGGHGGPGGPGSSGRGGGLLGQGRYHEQLVRLDGLSTAFARPVVKSAPNSPGGARPARGSAGTEGRTGGAGKAGSDEANRANRAAEAADDAATRRSLGIPTDAHIYLVPQTLMKVTGP